ncbi:hypothetical protein [uncultured Nocardioides sp.]|uniref:hypothetical protein n=1 Tax=uncultured Nocardioides sp. TaxID=198441 RepID=UPI000C489BBF|nr:hypothetical protein [uncultured Nocardioides sp.]MAY95060.1 hypothetical protein [Nocardioides sp.]MCK5929103.1 hypothetical protein [Nocardioides sp.]
MKKSLKRAVAVSAVCAAGLAGTLTTTTTATADEARKAPAKELTDFGMTALAYGTKVGVGGVDIKTLKDAKTLQACTRTAGLERLAPSLLSTDQITALLGDALPVDVAELIKLSPSTSTTETYTNGNITGVKAVNTIADIQLGGEVIDNISIPTIKIEGLKSVADSFYDPADTDGDGKKFGTAESFGFGDLKLLLPEDGVIGETLNLLLENLGLSTEDLNEVINVPLGILVDTLQQIIDTAGLGDVIEIPGLGSIGLGSSFRKIGNDAASSGANALQIEVNPSGEENGHAALLKLGYAQSRISAPVKSGVFRSTIMGLDFKALPLADDVELLHMGGIGTQAIPCEGTANKKVTKAIEGARSIPLNIPGLGGLATLNGIEYSYKAKQLARGRAKSMAKSKLGSLEIPVLGLEIQGISSRLNLKKFPGERVRGSNKPKFKVLDILHDGESILPENLRIGDVIEFVVDELEQTGFITFGKVKSRNYYGAKLSAINITIPGLFDIDLGWLESQIYPK